MRDEAVESLIVVDLDSVQRIQGQVIAYDAVLDYLKEEIK